MQEVLVASDHDTSVAQTLTVPPASLPGDAHATITSATQVNITFTIYEHNHDVLKMLHIGGSGTQL